MRRRFLFAVFGWAGLAVASGSRATNLTLDVFPGPELDLTYETSHCMRSDWEVLFFRGRSEALNAYLAHRRKQGAPLARKVYYNLGIYHVSLSLGRDAEGFLLGGLGLPARPWGGDLRRIVQALEYFASPRWRPFGPDEQDSGTESDLGRILDREVGEVDLSFFAGRRAVVYERGKLQVVYENDKLSYRWDGRTLDIEPGDPLPVRIADRYVLGSPKAMYVLDENGREILRAPMGLEPWSGPCPVLRARAYRKWVNVGCGALIGSSYSYARNRLYEVIVHPPADSYFDFADPHGGRCSGGETGTEIAPHPPPRRILRGRR